MSKSKINFTFEKIIIMKTKYLFHAKYRNIGWFIFVPATILGLVHVILEWAPAFLEIKVFGIFIEEIAVFGDNEKKFAGFTENNIFNEILGVLIILSGLLVAFSREKDEDELITKIRLECLVWATYWNYGILILAFLLVYELSFFWVMVFNMFTILYLFIIRYTLAIRKLKASTSHEE